MNRVINAEVANKINREKQEAINTIMKKCIKISALSVKIEESIKADDEYSLDVAVHETELEFAKLIEYTKTLWIYEG